MSQSKKPWATAIQSLNKQDQVTRQAFCPRHEKVSSQFIGPVEEGWKFRCREGHDFVVKPDKYAPKTVEETVTWIADQKMARITKETSKRQ